MSQDWTTRDVSEHPARAAATINECLTSAVAMRAQLTRLQAIVAKLPKCWRLKDGKHVQDVPVVPNKHYYYRRSTQEVAVFLATCITHEQDGWWINGRSAEHGGVGIDPSECYDTREAAEAAKEK